MWKKGLKLASVHNVSFGFEKKVQGNSFDSYKTSLMAILHTTASSNVPHFSSCGVILYS